jgi:hypothetical protein
MMKLYFGQAEADLIRATERERLRALVEANMEVAPQLHEEDFQLINPHSDSLSREQDLGVLLLANATISCGSPTDRSAPVWAGSGDSIPVATGNRSGATKDTTPALLAHRLLLNNAGMLDCLVPCDRNTIALF